MTIEERATERMEWIAEEYSPFRLERPYRIVKKTLMDIATEQKAIDKESYKELIDMLIDELQTSRAYHLGITGLDSDAEIARKEQEGNTALIRGIDRTIKFVRKAMEE